jgi:hypothetical protein
MYGKAHKRPKLAKPRDPSKSNSRFSNQVTAYRWTSWCPRHQVYCANGRVSHEETIQICHGVRGSLPILATCISCSHSQLRKPSTPSKVLRITQVHGVEVKHYHADNGILHPNHGRIIAANATKECHTPESTHHQMDDVSDAFGPSRNRPDAH